MRPNTLTTGDVTAPGLIQTASPPDIVRTSPSTPAIILTLFPTRESTPENDNVFGT
jgi:hypothetical protein